MEIWLIMLLIGILTFSIRLSFIVLLERIQLPEAFLRALRFVPIAVLSAIIAPELAMKNNQLFLSLANPRLLAGVAATLVAYRTRSVVWSILAGMAIFWGLKLVLGM